MSSQWETEGDDLLLKQSKDLDTRRVMFGGKSDMLDNLKSRLVAFYINIGMFNLWGAKKLISCKELKKSCYFNNYCKFVATVHTTLPISTASQGVSFAFKELYLNPFRY